MGTTEGVSYRVVLPGVLHKYTGGEIELDMDAGNVRQLFKSLGERFPNLAPHLVDGYAVAIDGVMYQDALFQRIPDGSEVHLIPKIAGG